MNSLKAIVGSILLGGGAILAVSATGFAQNTGPSQWQNAASSRADWERRSTQGWRARSSAGQVSQTALTDAPFWSSTARRVTPWTGTSMVSSSPQPSVMGGQPVMAGPDTPYEDLMLTPPAELQGPVPPGATQQGMPMQGQPGGYGPGAPMGACVSGTCFDGGGSPSGGPYWGPGAYWGPAPFHFLRNLSIFAGTQGFTGPADNGRNGNFGLHYGVDWGSALGDPWGVGLQLGFEAVHSDFQGHRAPNGAFNNGDRDQVFFTAGLFRRAMCGGLQWGVAFDLMHDSYYYTADLKQVRAEVSIARPGWREIGFWGAFGVGDDQIMQNNQLQFTLEPISQFNFFYRRYFQNGGNGRLWAGFTANSDFTFGGDLWIPINRNWAIQNNFNLLVPGESGAAAQLDESWSLMLQVVWYPGNSVRTSPNNPFRPLFNVADNTVFMVDRN